MPAPRGKARKEHRPKIADMVPGSSVAKTKRHAKRNPLAPEQVRAAEEAVARIAQQHTEQAKKLRDKKKEAKAASAPVPAKRAEEAKKRAEKRRRKKDRKKEKRSGVEAQSAAGVAEAEEHAAVAAPSRGLGGRKHIRHKVLVFASRGLTARDRYFLKDLHTIIPHHKKEAKMEKKQHLATINEMCELVGCDSVMYLEARKRQDMYMWLASPAQGPSIKFLVQNIHTMGELKMTGNCLKGSRPILNFDAGFEANPLTRLFKTVIGQVFNTPNRHYKSKPFFDHIFNFSLLDGRVWFRNFQVVWPDKRGQNDEIELAEIGPRFALLPIRVFSGSFEGETIYQNDDYVSPNQIRAEMKEPKQKKYVRAVLQKRNSKKRKEESIIPPTELDMVFKD